MSEPVSDEEMRELLAEIDNPQGDRLLMSMVTETHGQLGFRIHAEDWVRSALARLERLAHAEARLAIEDLIRDKFGLDAPGALPGSQEPKP